MMRLRGEWTLLLLVGLHGCGLDGRTENIKPGEADYPVVNSTPKHVLELQVSGSPAFHLKLIIGYRATIPGGPTTSVTACAYEAGLAVPMPYSTARYIDWTGGAYRGEIALDRYQPGRCKWDFAGAWFTVEDSTVQHQELFFYDGRPDSAATNRIDLWCIKPAQLGGARACAGINGLRANFPKLISTATLQSIVNAGNAHDPPIHISLDVGPIQIRIHDLDKYPSNGQANAES
jgi:hypothetical protein